METPTIEWSNFNVSLFDHSVKNLPYFLLLHSDYISEASHVGTLMDGDGIMNIYIYIVHLIMMSNKLSPTTLKYVGCWNTTCASKEEEIDILYNGGI